MMNLNQQVSDIEHALTAQLNGHDINVQGCVIGLLMARWLCRFPAGKREQVRAMHAEMVSELMVDVEAAVKAHLAGRAF